MPIMPKKIDNPYLMGTFKHHFIEEFNKVCVKKAGHDVSVSVLMAEGFAILLDLINTDQAQDEAAVTLMMGELDGKATKAGS